jgi:hypothetical protein
MNSQLQDILQPGVTSLYLMILFLYAEFKIKVHSERCNLKTRSIYMGNL